MAKEAGYYDNPTEEQSIDLYSEGPFVIVNAAGWRIEVQLEGHHCPILPHHTIYNLSREWGYPPGKYERDRAARLCDRLNKSVKSGQIVKVGAAWLVKGTAHDFRGI